MDKSVDHPKKEIAEAKKINLEPETQEEFGDAESIVEI